MVIKKSFFMNLGFYKNNTREGFGALQNVANKDASDRRATQRGQGKEMGRGTTYGNHCAAVGVGVPGLLVDLQRPLGHQQADEGRHFGG